MSNIATHQLVADGFGYLNNKNLDAFFALYSDDLRNPTLATLGLPTNKTGFMTFVGMFYTAFTAPQFLPQKVTCEGDTAIFHYLFKGTHTGDFNGVQPTGKPVEVNAFVRFRVGHGGKIIEQHDCADLMTLMRQIGAIS